MRHGKIASHRGDVPLTGEGVAQARERGRLLAENLSAGEVVHFMHAPTLRTRQTAEEIRASMSEALGPDADAQLLEVTEQSAIRNPDLYVAGQRVEMVSSADALARQLSAPPVSPEALSEHPFFREFWTSPDRIGYWVGHPDPPGEDPVAVARRQLTFAMSLPEKTENKPVRYILSTHSPVLRAILRCYTKEDPGEPGYLEPVDLILSGNSPPELRFRDLRTFLSDTRVAGAAPRQTARGRRPSYG
ncbi:MAG TPA: histidine phosphatase family protein [Rubrobacteraceae bacterium]|nr:histidine phosphatase family protein [Rubrobacteraceae bacterium]